MFSSTPKAAKAAKSVGAPSAKIRSSSLAPEAKQKLSTAFNNIPWNFNAHLQSREVENMIAPIDLGSEFLLSHEATAIYKQFVQGIYENDMSDLEGICEPSFFEKAKSKVDDAHKLIEKHNLNLCLENFRQAAQHRSEFFLYNIDNYVLFGEQVSLDRRKNTSVKDFIIEEGQSVNIGKTDVPCTHIGHIKDAMDSKLEVTLVMRAHLLIHSFTNMYV